MPYLVVPEKRDSEIDPMLGPVRRNWIVAWAVLPYFLAANTALIRHVDQRLREAFQGRRLFVGDQRIQGEMSKVVIEAILEKNPIQGLREVLEAILKMKPSEKLSEEEVPNLEPPPKEKPPPLTLVTLDEAIEETAP